MLSLCLTPTCAGITLDVVLVTLICPKAIIGGSAPVAAGQSALQRWLAKVPAAALEASVKGAYESFTAIAAAFLLHF